MNPTTLADFRGDCSPAGTQLNFQHCPVCGSDEKKVYVNPEDGTWFCFAGSHHAGGKVDVGLDDASPGADLLRQLERLVPDEVIWSETEMPPWEPLSRSAIRYLLNRMIGPEDARCLGLVEWTDQGRILVPYFSGGELIFWTGRRYSKAYGEGPKYMSQPGKKPLYFPVGAAVESWFDFNSVTLVEGVFDAIRVTQAGCPAVALGGKSLPSYHYKEFLTFAEPYGIINVMLDEDALGDALKIQDTLSARTDAEVRIIPIEGDPADMPKHEIRRLLP